MTHVEKWKAVWEELKANHPASNATVWTAGYVFGLTHAADMASRSRDGAGNAKPQCTPSQQAENPDKVNSKAQPKPPDSAHVLPVGWRLAV